MKTKKKNIKGFLVIYLKGEMEAYDAENFESEMTDIIKSNKKDIIIDFHDLGYISSSGLRVLLNIRSQLLKKRRKVLLASLGERVLDVFRSSKLLEIFDVYKDVNEAISKSIKQ